MKFIFTFLLCCFSVAVEAQLTLQDSLLLYMPFNGDATDVSGNNNHGTVINATLTADRNGIANGAYNFNGTDSYIEIPASASLAKIYTSNEVTISAWINIRNWYQGWNVFAIFEQYDPVTDYGSTLFEANWASGGILFLSGYSTTNYIGCDYTWNFNAWHHAVVTYSTLSGTAKFYIDGVLVCSKPYVQTFSPDNTNTYVIGRSLSGPNEYSDGIIDEVKIYNRVLTDDEVITLPLNLLSFTGKYQAATGATLQWETTAEYNTHHFDIERSSNGINFEKIGSLTAGNSSYSFTDNKFNNNLFYYRLKMVDRDGKFTYSKTIKLAGQKTGTFTVFPNPVKGMLSINGLLNKGTIRLLTIDGKILKEYPAVSNMQIDMSSYAKGSYLLQYIHDTGMAVQKITRQ